MKKIITFFFLIGAISSASAQLGFCPGDKGDPIFTEDFGTGTMNGPALPTSVTSYNFVTTMPFDGDYTISSNLRQLTSFHNAPDHTIGDINGKALIVNASFTADQFYQRTITNLCENNNYEFSAWLLNVYDPNANVCVNGGIPVNVRFEIWNASDTVLLASGDTGNIGSTSLPTWEQYGLVFQTAVGQTEVILRMRNNGNGGCGNDLAIDDILFASCGDETVITSTEAEQVFCETDAPLSFTLTATPDGSVYTAPAIQWQESLDQVTFRDILGETSNTLVVTNLNSNRYYRINIAADAINLGSPLCSAVSDAFAIEFVSIPPSPVSMGDISACDNEPIPNLRVNAIPDAIISWYDSDTSTTVLATGPSFTPAMAGTYYASASAIGVNCENITRTAVTLTINASPIAPVDQNDILICEGQESLFLDAGLSGFDYLWNTGATTQVLEITSPGEYNVIISNRSTGCKNTRRFVVTAAILPQFEAPPFTIGRNVVLRVSTPGVFLYSLDGLSFQESPVFQNIAGGIYTGYVKDQNACDPTTISFYHLQIPQFFTPNGDGFHDFFELPNIEFFTSATVSIFDRYGKLIHFGNQNSFKWDGNYINAPLPSSDYWYVITLDDVQFKGHFSLKR